MPNTDQSHKDHLAADHVLRLRAELARRNLDGFIIPLTDEHMSEYVGDYAQRLAWLTGFLGSAGNAVVLADKAAIFIDGRYTVQVKDQVNGDVFDRLHFMDYPMKKWLIDHATKGDKIGYDPELATTAWEKTMHDALTPEGLELVAINGTNPIDAVWHNQPALPQAVATTHGTQYTGRSAADKRSDIALTLKEKHADSAVITMLDSVAWYFNIRGQDVDNTPVTHAFALAHADETADLFIAGNKVTDRLRETLGNSVRIRERSEFYTALSQLGAAGKSVLVDPASNNAKILTTLEASGATLIQGQDPCILPKAVKNSIEAQGMRDCHVRDGAAVSEFLAFLSREAHKEKLDELSAAQHLKDARFKREMIHDLSFRTISAAGPNGALCHYSVTQETNLPIKRGDLYLVDSGGQYSDGTTDITRTIAVGEPTLEMCERFTLVLKGHIDLSNSIFPQGTSGSQLDSIARRPLWQHGLDFDHGTGHGVGCYLAVHEGPQRIAKQSSDVALQPGMALSNEPGYYKEGAYGIRIENLVLVVEKGDKDGRKFLGFENLTWAPIDRNLVVADMLSNEQLAWLNQYHSTVFDKLHTIVDGETLSYLKTATAPI